MEKPVQRNKYLGTVVSRRRFGALTLALAGARLVPAGPSKEKRWRMRLSTSTLHFADLPLEEACAKIAAQGFEAVDIWSAFAGCKHLDYAVDKLKAEGLRRLLSEKKLKLFSFSVYKGGYRKYAAFLGECGGGVAVRGSTRPCKPKELTARMRAFLESLKPLAELAERYNSYIAIENHGRALLDSLDSFKAFVDLNSSPRIGIALAPFHLQGIGASVTEAIEIAGKQLFFFYAWQRGRGVKQLPGWGPTDFTPWIEALARVGYKGCVNPFMHGHLPPDVMAAALGRARSYLLKCAAKAGVAACGSDRS